LRAWARSPWPPLRVGELLQRQRTVAVVLGGLGRGLRGGLRLRHVAGVEIEPGQHHPVPVLARIQLGHRHEAGDHRGGVDLAAVAPLQRDLGVAPLAGGLLDVGRLFERRFLAGLQLVEDGEGAGRVAGVELGQRDGAFGGRGGVGHRPAEDVDRQGVGPVLLRQLGDVAVLRGDERGALAGAGAHLQGQLVDLRPFGAHGVVGGALLGRLRRRGREQRRGHLGVRVDGGRGGGVRVRPGQRRRHRQHGREHDRPHPSFSASGSQSRRS